MAAIAMGDYVIEEIDLVSDDDSVIEISDSESETGNNYKLLPIDFSKIKTEKPNSKVIQYTYDDIEVQYFDAYQPISSISSSQLERPTSPQEPPTKKFKLTVKKELISLSNGLQKSDEELNSLQMDFPKSEDHQSKNHFKFPIIPKEKLESIIDFHQQFKINNHTSTTASMASVQDLVSDEISISNNDNFASFNSHPIENEDELLNFEKRTPSPTIGNSNDNSLDFTDFLYDGSISLSPEITKDVNNETELEKCKSELCLSIRKSKYKNIFHQFGHSQETITDTNTQEEMILTDDSIPKSSIEILPVEDLTKDRKEERIFSNDNINLPFACKYLSNFPQNSSGIDFDEYMENSVEAVTLEIDFTIKGIEMLTVRTLRPPKNLLSKLFSWTIQSSTKHELNFRLSVLRHIHHLHGFPKPLLLWDFIEEAYSTDLIEKTVFSLEIKACVLDFICFILEADFHSTNSTNKFADCNSRAYKLLAAPQSYGNLKTIVAWLEDTIKLYYECLNSDVSQPNSSATHYFLIIECLQKLLTFSVCASGNSLCTTNYLAGEIVSAHDNMNSAEQKHLLITGIKSNFLLMVTIEKLLEQIPLVDNELRLKKELASSWSDTIVNYFGMFSLTNMRTWSTSELIHYVFIFLMLIQTYIEGSRNQTHNMPTDCFSLINDEIFLLETRVKGVIDMPYHLIFLFGLIKCLKLM